MPSKQVVASSNLVPRSRSQVLPGAFAHRGWRQRARTTLPLVPGLQPRLPDPEQALLVDELATQGTSVSEGRPPLPSLNDRANIKARIRMPVNLQPTLKGQLVELRPLRAEDFLALYAVAADPLIWEQHPSPDRYQEPVFRVYFQDAMESRGALLATDSQSGQV